MDVEAPIFAQICIRKKKFVCLFIGEKFEKSTLGSSYVNILQTVTDKTNIAITNK